MPLTPYMGLLLPDPTVTPGPTYATEEVTAFTTIDSHNHTEGNGAPIPTLALDIDNDLPFNGYNATEFRAVRFNSQSATLSLPTDITELYVVNGNLFYNNQLGQPVQITNGAAIDATSIGGIGGDYATSTASVFYTAADETFTFWSNTNTTASIAAGPISFANNTLNSPSITFAPSNTIASSYQLTWPGALPTSNAALQISPSGVLSYSAGGNVPTGAVFEYVGLTAPAGYLMLDGTSYLQSAYPALFAIMGTAFGSVDSSHFNVPDMRGMFARGALNGGPSGNDPDSGSRGNSYPGGNTGNAVGSTQGWQIQSHTHVLPANNAGGSGVVPAILYGQNHNTDINAGFTGGNQTNPINLYFNYIIKT
jgi:microcystin-dependent protein